MTLGEKLKNARLEAGLSQRALCEGIVTRNMLSQIENGSARPSMDTLARFASRLGKPVSFFLEEDGAVSLNQPVMDRARRAFDAGNWTAALEALEDFRGPDPVYDRERGVLTILAALRGAEDALAEGRRPYALELLEKVGKMGESCPYYPPELENKRILLGLRAGGKAPEILPSLDGELLLRARAALAQGEADRAARLLDAAEDRRNPEWNFLRGEAYRKKGEYAPAAECYHRAEDTYPEAIPGLEECCRELGDYKQAYYYACKQR